MKNKDENIKSLQSWSKIKHAVFGPSSLSRHARKFQLNPDGYNKERGRHPLVLQHGTELLESVHINYAVDKASISSVIHNAADSCYIITFTDGNLCCYYDNNRQNIYQSSQQILHIVYSEKYQNYVAICKDFVLRILAKDFELISVIPFSGNLDGMTYNEFTDEIITYGKGSITIWLFRTAGTLLIPKKIISENLSTNDAISYLCLEDTSSCNQRCFAAVTTSILVYNMKTGSCLQHLQNIHNMAITQILFYPPLKLLVTAGSDGSIKTWDSSWNLNCLFIGHTSSITSLSVYPYGPYIMSASLDCTFRIWSLDSKDEIHCKNLNKQILGLTSQLSKDLFFSFTKEELFLWRVFQLHTPFTVIGSKTIALKITSSSEHSPVPYCICDDGCIRLFCPVSGDIITTFMSPDYMSIVDAEYHINENLLFVLLCDGRIVKVSTLTNPCTTLQIWTANETKAPSTCTCFSLYEYINKTNFNEDKWEDAIEKALMLSQRRGKTEGTLLIGGCADGHIVIFDWYTSINNGKVVFTLQAHRDAVIAMSSNTTLNQLATASKDKTLKIWRVFPFATEALAPLMIFLHPYDITALAFLQYSLSVIYQDNSTSSYLVTVYKTTVADKAKLIAHPINEEHNDYITSVATCPKLRLIASASMDRTIRIWNQENQLIRVLKLNDVAHIISFGSERGDLLLGIGTNIHIINFQRYLPQRYMYQTVAMTFNEIVSMNQIPIVDNIILTAEEKLRVYKSHSSFMKVMQFVDDIPQDELNTRNEEEKVKEKEFAILEARNRELNLIKDGLLKANHGFKMNSKLKDESFKKYLELFYNRPAISYPKDDVLDDSDEEKFLVRIDDSFKPDVNDDGFFAINANSSDMKNIKEKLKKLHEGSDKETFKSEEKTKPVRSLSLNTDSIQFKRKRRSFKHSLSASTTYTERLKAMKKLQLKKDFDFIPEKLPVINATSDQYPYNEEMTRQINKSIATKVEKSLYLDKPKHGTIPVAPDGFLPNSVVVALYKELRREITQEEQMEKWFPKQLTDDQLSELNSYKKKLPSPPPSPPSTPPEMLTLPAIDVKRSRIMEQFDQAQEKILLTDENDNNLDTPPPTPPITPEVEIIKDPSVVKEIRVVQPKKPIQKLISRPKVPEKPKTPPREPTPPPPPPSPLPQFIEQFQSSMWFQKCFPRATSKNFKETKTVENFVKLLLQYLVEQDGYETKSSMTTALILLNQQYEFDVEIRELVKTTLLNELNLVEGAPSSTRGEELLFIRKCIQLMKEMKDLSNMVIVELMVQFILAPSFFRQELIKLFASIGIEDSKEYFSNELYSAFDVSLVKPALQRKKLHELCFDWIVTWTKKFKQHITSLTGKIARATKGKVVRGTAKPENVKSILKKNAAKSASKDKGNRAIAFLSDDFVTDAANHVTPVEVINYFCEIKLEEEIERARLEALKQKAKPVQEKNKVQKNRNAVLMLPKVGGLVSLARIGETHQSKCHPERETSLANDITFPPIENKHGVHSLLLHLNRLTLNPFPCEMDELLYAPTLNSDLVTLRSSQKYFIPSHSCVSTVKQETK